MHIFAISYRAAIMAQKVSQAVYDSGKGKAYQRKKKTDQRRAVAQEYIIYG